MAKEGSTIGGLMDSLGTATSVALQYGVPVESLVNKFTHQRFEPAGMTTNQDIPFAKSLVDYIFRWMGMQFIPGYRAANAPQRGRPGADTNGHTQGAGRALSTEDPLWKTADVKDALTELKPTAPSRAVGLDPAAAVAAPSPGAGAGPGIGLSAVVSVETSTLTVAMESMGDSPACDVCGTITVRSGTCYKCLNCGNSMGCS